MLVLSTFNNTINYNCGYFAKGNGSKTTTQKVAINDALPLKASHIAAPTT